ncbi:hypothetical protein HPB51_021521 [Rhipicephalus microplus]|uniref:SAP domain-containing protein n=1 Tax=Rhipicephalus microplus TaxID=6941 RepID=A0A9J6DIM6_RHIMP|nr:hypothetical protein HPB51_021521 [Rhipicephalus microplus]
MSFINWRVATAEDLAAVSARLTRNELQHHSLSTTGNKEELIDRHFVDITRGPPPAHEPEPSASNMSTPLAAMPAPTMSCPPCPPSRQAKMLQCCQTVARYQKWLSQRLPLCTRHFQSPSQWCPPWNNCLHTCHNKFLSQLASLHFAHKLSKSALANLPPKVHKDCKKKKWSTPSPNALKSTSNSYFSSGSETTLKSEKSGTTLGSSNRKKRRKQHMHKKDWQIHSPKYSSKKASSHTEVPDKKLTISSNMTAKSSEQSSKEDQFPHKTKPLPCPVMTPTPNSDESPSEEHIPAHDPADLVDLHTLPSCAHEAAAQPPSQRPQRHRTQPRHLQDFDLSTQE